MSPGKDKEKSAGELGREALAHWRDAARYGAKAISERGWKLGDLGEKFAESVRGGGGDNGAEADDSHLFDATAPLPIQEAIDVAVPVAAVFDLLTRFEELPRFSERISEAEAVDDSQLELEIRIGGRVQALTIEITGEEPEERLDWRCVEGPEHSGVLTLHPLAPRLTRIELTVEQEEEGALAHLLRLSGLTGREIRQELRRFKAYAELWDEANDYKSADFKEPEPEPEEEEEPEPEEEEEPEPEGDEEPEPAAGE